jgi:hypothetical protein
MDRVAAGMNVNAQQIGKSFEVTVLLAKELPGQFNIRKGKAGLLAFRACVHTVPVPSYGSIVIAIQYGWVPLICQTAERAAYRLGAGKAIADFSEECKWQIPLDEAGENA